MRNYGLETEKRVEFIKRMVESAGSTGIVFGNSGGKDSALVGILCKIACENTLGLIMPCGPKQNYGEDMTDAETVAQKFNIASRVIDLTDVKNNITQLINNETPFNGSADANIAPRLRMTTLYAVAANENRLVAGTGNRSEVYMGYFTKWGDGAYDFNPIADFTVSEVYEFLNYLGAPDPIINKPPSAGLFDGQTDEREMGVTYRSIDRYLFTGTTYEQDMAIIEKLHKQSEHKRKLPVTFGEVNR